MTPHRATSAERDEEAAISRNNMARDIADLKAEVAELRGDIKGLVEAWRNANFGVSVVKFIGTLVIAASTFWYAWTHFGEPR